MTRDEAMAAVIAAVRAECAKFRFPDEDRPELWNALRALDELPAPECARCDDRGRIWSGPDGETEHCPQCAVWGVWLTMDGSDVGWMMVGFNRPYRDRRREAERAAHRYTPDPSKRRKWTAEVRRLVPEEK